jgi:hypothetical protein
MADPAANPTSQFSIGKVLKQTFSAFLRRITHFLPLGLLCYLPVAFISYAQNASMLDAQATGDLAQALNFNPFWIALNFLLPMVCAGVFAAIATYEVVMDETGVRPSLGEAIAAAAPRILPVILASILFTLIVYAGMILLLLPGLFLLAMLWVSVPAVVMEGLGPIAALKRSANLTKGYRWRVFGLIVLFIILVFILQWALSLALILGTAEITNVFVLTGFGYLGITIFGVLSALAIAYTYVALKITKEGASVEQLATVFQ